MNNLFFDIETGKAPDYQIFEPKYKEPRITAKGAIHASDKSIEDQRDAWIKSACLSPFTGRVIMIGCIQRQLSYEVHYEQIDIDEKFILRHFWELYDEHDFVVGFNIKGFDLPFMARRSMKLGVTMPELMDRHNKYFLDKVIDLRDILACGEWQSKGSLDDYSKFFGLPSKDNDVSKDFEYIWNTDKPRAIKGNQIEVENIRDIFNIINKTKPVKPDFSGDFLRSVGGKE